jgi:glucose/arabinose dehydrogenase
MSLRPPLAPLVLSLAAASVLPAQVPDCTGVSTVFNAHPELAGELTTVVVASGLSRPLFVTAPPGDTTRVFIVEQDGKIKIVKNGGLLGTPFLDLGSLTRSPADCNPPSACDEQGLLGLAFHPDYASNRTFFVFHTNAGGTQEELVRYMRDPVDPDEADPSTRTVVLTVPTHFSNHNGGMLAFSPIDGDLYVATGDGGSACDPLNAGQDLEILNGKLLRLSVDSLPYSTEGNPYDGATAGLDEIWSFGLRNPYRFSIDREEGTLYIGDVGQNLWEEIDCQPATSDGGENYGWDRYEGDHCPNPSCGSSGSCTLADYAPPIREYEQLAGACAVTGGYVYRGCRMPDLRGTYFYADYCAAFVRSFRTDASCAAGPDLSRTADLAPSGASIDLVTSFGEDAQGELYLVDRNGEVFKVLPTLAIMEVSGPGAAPLVMGDASWTWENLLQASGHPTTEYRVYRSPAPTGPFDCVKRAIIPRWTGGDPAVPASGEAFYYLVTARHATEETTAGARSDGTLRVVNTGSTCP